MALSGTFRAAALFGAPAAVGALLSVAALTPVLVGVAAVTILPAALVGRPRARQPSEAAGTDP
jgi:hypothetical protein